MADEDNNNSASNGIQVICAGLGRTGTVSLTEALTILGYKPYHFVGIQHHKDWAEFAQGKRTAQAVIQRIVDDGYTATLDNPACDIYQDILKEYPQAKVILTVRDSPQAFCASWKTLFDTMVVTEQKFSLSFPSFFGYIPLFDSLFRIRQFMGTTHLGLQPGELTHGWRDKANSDEWLAEQYARHNQHVIDTVPKDQLLVFNVKEGWEPLCQFLGKDTPDGAFPHAQVNSTKSLRKLRQTFLMIVYGWIPATVAIGLGTAVALSWFGSDGKKAAKR